MPFINPPGGLLKMKYCTLRHFHVDDQTCFDCKYPKDAQLPEEIKKEIAWNDVSKCIFQRRSVK
jgi:ribosomal protein L37E